MILCNLTLRLQFPQFLQLCYTKIDNKILHCNCQLCFISALACSAYHSFCYSQYLVILLVVETGVIVWFLILPFDPLFCFVVPHKEHFMVVCQL